MSKADTTRAHEYLQHILDAIQRIDRYVEDFSEIAFLSDEKTQDAVIRNFEIIGEACNNVTKHHAGFAEMHAEVPSLGIRLLLLIYSGLLGLTLLI